MGKFGDTPASWAAGKGRLQRQLPSRRQACTTLFANTSVIYGPMATQMEGNRKNNVAIRTDLLFSLYLKTNHLHSLDVDMSLHES